MFSLEYGKLIPRFNRPMTTGPLLLQSVISYSSASFVLLEETHFLRQVKPFCWCNIYVAYIYIYICVHIYVYVCFTLFNKLSPGSLKDGCSASCHISRQAASLQRTVMSVVMAIHRIGCVSHTLFRTFIVKPLNVQPSLQLVICLTLFLLRCFLV